MSAEKPRIERLLAIRTALAASEVAPRGIYAHCTLHPRFQESCPYCVAYLEAQLVNDLVERAQG